MAYRAGVVHDPQAPRVAKALASTQNKALRKVLRAYKAISICRLETKAYYPSLELYFSRLKKRLKNVPLQLNVLFCTSKG